MRIWAPKPAFTVEVRQLTLSRARSKRNCDFSDAVRNAARRVPHRMRRILRDLRCSRISSTAPMEVRASMGCCCARRRRCVTPVSSGASRQLFAQILYCRALGVRSRFRETAPAIEAWQQVAQWAEQRQLVTWARRCDEPDLLIITNVWPTSQKPAYGPFVKRSVDGLEALGIKGDVLFI